MLPASRIYTSRIYIVKKIYKINNFLVLLICLTCEILYPCKINKQLNFKLFSQDQYVISSAISSNGEKLMMSVKNSIGNCIVDWDLHCNSVNIHGYDNFLCKEIKFSQNDLYIGFNYGTRLDIHGQEIESRFCINQTNSYICGFDISENFDAVAFYDNNQNIYVYNLNNPTEALSTLRETSIIRSIRFITQITGRGFLAVETLNAIKFYDIFTCTLKHIHMIKDKTENKFNSFCGICVDDGYYAALSSLAKDGSLETEIHLFPTDEEKTKKKYSQLNIHNNLWVMDAPRCTADPDVILFTGRKMYGNDAYEQVNLFSISKNKYINFKLFKIETDLESYFKSLAPESLQNDSLSLRNGRLLTAQLTSKNQLIFFLKNNSPRSFNMTHAVFIDIDFNSPNNDFQVMYNKRYSKFYLISK